MVNVEGLKPRSVSIADATSNSVVSAGNFFCKDSPVGKRRLRRASVYETSDLGCWDAGAGGAGGAGVSICFPSLAAFLFSA